MNNDKKIENIITALGKHEDSSSVAVLEEIGTNSSDEKIRTMTAKALVQRNTPESLEIVINRKGKGINDLSSQVAMETINHILELKDKTNVLKVLGNTSETAEDIGVKECASSVKTLLEFSTNDISTETKETENIK